MTGLRSRYWNSFGRIVPTRLPHGIQIAERTKKDATIITLPAAFLISPTPPENDAHASPLILLSNITGVDCVPRKRFRTLRCRWAPKENMSVGGGELMVHLVGNCRRYLRYDCNYQRRGQSSDAMTNLYFTSTSAAFYLHIGSCRPLLLIPTAVRFRGEDDVTSRIIDCSATMEYRYRIRLGGTSSSTSTPPSLVVGIETE